MEKGTGLLFVARSKHEGRENGAGRRLCEGWRVREVLEVGEWVG